MVAATLLPLILFGVVTWTTYGLALSHAEQLVRRTVDVLHQHTLKVFETQELILDQATMLSEKLVRETDSRELNEALRRLEKGWAQSSSIWVLDSAGDVRASSTTLTAPLNGSDRDYFQAHLHGGTGTYVGKAFVGRASGLRSFGFSRRLSNPDGSFAGVISISASSDYFREFFKQATPPGEDDVAVMFRTDGEQLARDPPDLNDTRFVADDPLMRAVAVADAGVLWRMSRVDSKERLYAYRRIDGYPVIVSMAIPEAAILRPWLVSMFINLGVAISVTLILAALTCFGLWLSYREEAALVQLAAETGKREQMETHVRQWEKFGLIGEVTASVVHDFANLLTPILGNLYLVEKQIDHPRSPARVKAALAAARHGETLVRSILSFARQEPLALTTVDVVSTVEQMAELLTQTVGGTARLSIELAPGTWRAKVDLSGLETAILNLVINARDATAAGGTVRISTANRVLGGQPHGLAGEFVGITVTDTGCGMSSEVRARAFEPLFTTKPAGKGTGLGLSSVYEFAKRCGGTVSLDSEVGVGTTVTIYLPRAEPESPVRQA